MAIRSSALFLFALSFATVPLMAHDARTIFVLVDVAKNRAYIPEGTILPSGFSVRGARVVSGRRLLADPPRRVWPDLDTRSNNKPPTRTLIFEYAPIERFQAMQGRYALQTADKSRVDTNSHGPCSDIYMEASGEGLQTSYYSGFTARMCSPNTALVNGNYYLWEFTAEVTYAPLPLGDNGYAYVSDTNGIHNCVDYYTADGLSCTGAGMARWWWNSNTVTLGASYNMIEYQPNWEPYYISYYFESVWYTAFG